MITGTPADGGDGGGLIDAVSASDAARPAFCAVAGTVGCYEFEGNANDGSLNALHTTTSGVSFSPGEVGRAMQLDGSSTASVNPSLLFDVNAVTIEAWIRPAQLPASLKQFLILDVDQQYGFAVNDDGTLTCDLRGLAKFSTTAPSGAIASNQWTHVACTYDGTSAARIYVNGNLTATHSGAGVLSKGGHGMGIAQNYPSGSQLIGLIDQLRLLNVARSAADLCADASKTICINN